MIIVLGEARVKSGREAEALALSLTHVHRSRTEPGCITHDVSIEPEDKSKLVFVERWDDMPALLAHFAVPESKRFVSDLTAMLAEPPQMKIYNADEVVLGS